MLCPESSPRQHAAPVLRLCAHWLHAPNRLVSTAGDVARHSVERFCSALWAGIPSVCVPFIFDSRFWADRLFAIGASVRPLPVESLTSSALAAAIKEVASSASIKKAAESLKQGLVDHNGAASCANLLRRIMQRPWDRSLMEVALPVAPFALVCDLCPGASAAQR